MMDLRQLKYFVAVVQAKSFTAAAEKLHVSQPALGLQIRNLEEAAKVKLLDRHSRGVLPTEAGQVLLDHAQLILRQFEQTRQALENVGREPVGNVAIAVTPTIARNLVPTIISRCHEQVPQVLLSVFEGLSRELIRGVSESRFDICFTSNRREAKTLRLSELFEEDHYFVGPSNSPFSATEDIDLETALSLPLFLPGHPHGLRAIVENAAASHGFDVTVKLETNSTPMKRDMVVAGLGHTIMPFGAIRKEFDEGTVFARRIVNPGLTRRIYLGRRKDGPRSQATDAVYDIIVRLATDPMVVKEQRWRLLYDKSAGRAI